MSTSSQARLPTAVVPSRYRLAIDSDLDTATFSGTVVIDASVVEATPVITLNAAGLAITECRLTRDSQPVACSHELDEDAEQLIVTPGDGLSVGPVELHIEYSGSLDGVLLGYYISTFEIDGAEDRIGVTQFEASYARHAFPCWDEPAFKAVFEISLLCEGSLTAVSNAELVRSLDLGEGRTRHDFAPTMLMSTYLVAWAVGRLDISETVTARGTDIRVLHRPGTAELTSFALDCASHALEWFEDYYGIAYAGGKLDLVAVPDFAFGAMENNGCVTFRENLLLIDPGAVTSDELERAATVIEHEIAHMWFGNLVTMDWWDGIWLNEAFATLMELSCADAFDPTWSIWTSFEMMRSAAFDTDWLPSTRPIEARVSSGAETEDMFDVLTYEKGAAVLRMFEHWVGQDVFRDGIRSYLGTHAYQNTETSDLWTSLSDVTGLDVGAIFDEWIHIGGHPVVEIDVDGGEVTLTQRRFNAIDDMSSLPDSVPVTAAVGGDGWKIPIRYRARWGEDVKTDTLLLGAEPATLTFERAPDFFTPNVDATGFFRTSSTNTLARGWTTQVADMSSAETLYAIDTGWATLMTGRSTVPEMVSLICESAGSATSRHVWRRISAALDDFARLSRTAEKRVDHETCVAQIADAVLASGAQSNPVGISHSTSHSAVADRAAVEAIRFELAGTVAGRADAIGSALELLPTAIDPVGSAELGSDMSAAVLRITGMHGGAQEFERIVAWLRSSPSPQEELRAIRTLAGFTEAALAERFRDMCLTEIRTQNAPYALAQSLGTNLQPVEVWRFIAAHWEDMSLRFPTSSISRMVGGIRWIWDPSDAEEILDFFAAQDEQAGRRPIEQHLQRMYVNVAARRRLLEGLRESTSTP